MAKRNPAKALKVFGTDYIPMMLENEFMGMLTGLGDTWAPEFLMTPSVPFFSLTDGDGEIILKARMPGIKKEDVEVALYGRVLRVTTEKRERKGNDVQTLEQRSRSLMLPYEVNPDKVSVGLAKGILEIRVTKPEEAKTHRIEITARGPAITEKKARKSGRKG